MQNPAQSARSHVVTPVYYPENTCGKGNKHTHNKAGASGVLNAAGEHWQPLFHVTVKRGCINYDNLNIIPKNRRPQSLDFLAVTKLSCLQLFCVEAA